MDFTFRFEFRLCSNNTHAVFLFAATQCLFLELLSPTALLPLSLFPSSSSWTEKSLKIQHRGAAVRIMAWVLVCNSSYNFYTAYMVTGPYFLDLDPFRSSKSKLELVQFHSPYLKSNFVQFQIHSSSKILPKSSKFIPVAEILQAFLLNFSTYKTEKPCQSIKRPFSSWKQWKEPIWILSIANTSLKRSSI